MNTLYLLDITDMKIRENSITNKNTVVLTENFIKIFLADEPVRN